MNKVGNKIKELRQEAGLTQLQLGKEIGCSGQVVSNIERGCSRPSAEAINIMSELFHVPSDYLLGNSETKWIALNQNALTPNIGTHITELLHKENMTVESFASAAALSSGEAAAILAGSVTPNIDVLARISNVLHTSMDFLIGATPYPIRVGSEEEEDIVLYYRRMSKHGRRKLMGVLETLKDE